MEVFLSFDLSFERADYSGDSARRRLFFGILNCSRRSRWAVLMNGAVIPSEARNLSWMYWKRKTSAAKHLYERPIAAPKRRHYLAVSPSDLNASLATKELRRNRWLDAFASCGLV